MKGLVENRGHGFGVACVFSSSILLAFVGIIVKQLVCGYGLPMLAMTCWRNMIVALGMLAFLKMRGSRALLPRRGDYAFVMAYGFLLAVFNGIWVSSVYYNGAGIATVMTFSSLPLSGLVQWIVDGRRPGCILIPAVTLSFSGCVLVCATGADVPGSVSATGAMIGVVTGVLYTLYLFIGRESSRRGLGAGQVVMYTYGFASLFHLLANLLFGGVMPGTAENISGLMLFSAPWQAWVLIFLLALGPTMTGWAFLTLSLSYVSPVVANVIMSTEPLFTALLAIPLIGEMLSLTQWAGSLCIVLGVLTVTIRPRVTSGKIQEQGV